MGWQDTIVEMLQDARDMFVSYAEEQDLTNTEKATARSNAGILQTSATQISGDDYKIVIQ